MPVAAEFERLGAALWYAMARSAGGHVLIRRVGTQYRVNVRKQMRELVTSAERSPTQALERACESMERG